VSSEQAATVSNNDSLQPIISSAQNPIKIADRYFYRWRGKVSWIIPGRTLDSELARLMLVFQVAPQRWIFFLDLLSVSARTMKATTDLTTNGVEPQLPRALTYLQAEINLRGECTA
jgi:hypothetical protein